MAVTIASTSGVKITRGNGSLFTGRITLRPPSRVVADAQWFVALPVHVPVFDGVYSFTLESGLFWLHAPSTERVPVVVPATGGPYTIQELIEDPAAPPEPDPEAPIRDHLEFTTVTAMLFADSDSYLTAMCKNYEVDDGIITTWLKVGITGLTDNGDSVRQTNDGSWLIRTFPS
jgi:hypothetical protein